MRRICKITGLALAVFAGALTAGQAQAAGNQNPAASPSWSEKKCQLFTQYSSQYAGQAQGSGDENTACLSKDFLKSQDEFIASGCVARIHVCPTTPAELDYANRISLLMMNEGATGSFLPFLCDDGVKTRG